MAEALILPHCEVVRLGVSCLMDHSTLVRVFCADTGAALFRQAIVDKGSESIER